MMLKLPEFKDLILESVRGPTRAKFLAGYWFVVLGRKALLKKFIDAVIAWLWGFHSEVTRNYGDD